MNMNSILDQNLKARIMRRIYTYWFAKRVLPVLLVQFLALWLLLVGIHQFVAIRFVLRNALLSISSFPSLIDFTRSAFEHTGFITRLLFGASALLGVLILRDVIKALRGLRGFTSPGFRVWG